MLKFPEQKLIPQLIEAIAKYNAAKFGRLVSLAASASAWRARRIKRDHQRAQGKAPWFDGGNGDHRA